MKTWAMLSMFVAFGFALSSCYYRKNISSALEETIIPEKVEEIKVPAKENRQKRAETWRKEWDKKQKKWVWKKKWTWTKERGGTVAVEVSAHQENGQATDISAGVSVHWEGEWE